MYQAYKLPEGSYNIRLGKSIIYDIGNTIDSKEIITKCKNAELVCVLNESFNVIQTNFEGETKDLDELMYFINECKKYQVTSPVLVILKVW